MRQERNTQNTPSKIHDDNTIIFRAEVEVRELQSKSKVLLLFIIATMRSWHHISGCRPLI